MRNKMNPESPNTIVSQRSILIVDDDQILLKFYCLLLKDKYQVTAALGGKAAMEFFINQIETYDVILADLNMPEVNGIDLYNYIAQKNPGQEKRMIFFTGGAYTALSMDFLKKIQNPVLEKPVNSETILRAIDQMLHFKETS